MDEPGFDARATVAWSGDEALVAGQQGPGGGARMMRYSDGRLMTVYRREDGYFAAVDRSASYAWAVLGTPHPSRAGSEYTILRSPDRGATWSVAGPVPFNSVAQLEAVSDSELWVHARSALGRSVDGGLTWDVVHAPGRRNALDERLVATDGEVLLLSATSMRTRDGGDTWEPLGIDGKLVDTDDDWFLGELADRLAVRDPSGEWHHLPWSHPEAWPLMLRVEGDTVQALTTGRTTEGIVRWFESRDGGRTWRKGWIVADDAFPSWAIAPDGTIFAFEVGFPYMRVRRP